MKNVSSTRRKYNRLKCFFLIDWVNYQFITDKYFVISQECNEFDDRLKQPSRRNKNNDWYNDFFDSKSNLKMYCYRQKLWKLKTLRNYHILLNLHFFLMLLLRNQLRKSQQRAKKIASFENFKNIS